MAGFCFLTQTCNIVNTVLTAVSLEKHPLSYNKRNSVSWMIPGYSPQCLDLEAWEAHTGTHCHLHGLGHTQSTRNGLLSGIQPRSTAYSWADLAVFNWGLFSIAHNSTDPQEKKEVTISLIIYFVQQITLLVTSEPSQERTEAAFHSFSKWFPSVANSVLPCFCCLHDFAFDHESWLFFLQ